MTKEPTKCQYEAYYSQLITKLKATNPNWELTQEFGRMLMRHIDSFTPEERKRYEELIKILNNE